ncbi:MAG TPA: DinB family protein [Cyclobacteriaceae bacterium]|nr:DinB family protein [Cyclobacteriaceae bacterium]
MNNIPLAERLASAMEQVTHTINNSSTAGLEKKPAPGKWSKKEILGHLIDSAINNLQRFTEIQYQPQPYQVRRYSQDDLVIANGYQQASIDEILKCWTALNTRILNVIKTLPADKLSLPLLLPDGTKKDLEFLISDYVDHMLHHHRQLN